MEWSDGGRGSGACSPGLMITCLHSWMLAVISWVVVFVCGQLPHGYLFSFVGVGNCLHFWEIVVAGQLLLLLVQCGDGLLVGGGDTCGCLCCHCAMLLYCCVVVMPMLCHSYGCHISNSNMAPASGVRQHGERKVVDGLT